MPRRLRRRHRRRPDLEARPRQPVPRRRLPGGTAVPRITSSPAFVREPEGNGCAERFIRTLKENLLWVRTFETVEDLRQALLEFKRLYNEHWILERLGYRTPQEDRKNPCSAVEIAA